MQLLTRLTELAFVGAAFAKASPISSIAFNADLMPGSSPFFGVMQISNIASTTGQAVHVNQYLGVELLSPMALTPFQFSIFSFPFAIPFVNVTNKAIDSATYAVTAELNFAGGFTFPQGAILNIAINGDLVGDSEKYLSSITLAADKP